MQVNKIIFLFLLLFTGNLFSQNNKKTRDELDAMKVAFITKKLDLSAKEAQAFWPLYNEFEDKREALRMELRQLRKNAKLNIDEMTDAEADVYIETEMTYRQKDMELTKERQRKLKAVLSPKKIAILYRAEEQFKQILLEAVTEKKK
jgi:hypothetical protein